MFKPRWISIIFVIGLGLGTSTMAVEEHQHYSMRDLDKNLKKFKAAEDSKEAQAALQIMQQTVKSYQKHLPSKLQKLKAEDAHVVAYQGLLKDLLIEIKKAEQLLAAKQLQEAQNLSVKMDEIKKQGHQAFK
ncbi:cytochrome b562 [Acinetobacter schindleri]|uniref:cytochrome b562 n=1 Tax=Acinetobacter schindleri TaxID=108981 RepID=UPI0009726825|nr:cytochrome b562 [Acinetobacter schindleri]APX61933.1 cytochrome c/b562 protein [Acinetobacter schindleri]